MNISKKLNVIACGMVLAVFMLGGCNSSESSEQPEKDRAPKKSVMVTIEPVVPTLINDVLILPGQTEAWQDVTVAADTGGRIEWIGPAEGNILKKGQLIAKIDVSALKAALDRAEADYKLSDELFIRRKQLFEKEIIGGEELDRSENQRSLALANLRQSRIEYERGFVKSPINGIVNHLFVDAGEFADRGKPVADLVDVDKIKININVPELDVRYIKPGQETIVTIDAFPERKFFGTVDFVSYKADPATKTFLVRIVMPNVEHLVRPGMIARVALLRRTIPDALVAPLFALVDKGGERILFVEEGGVARARTVSIGIISGDRVQITEGLKEGDHLIVKGQTEVEEGILVKVQ